MPFTLQQVQRAADYWTAEIATYNRIINPDLVVDLDDNVRNYINKRNRGKNVEVQEIFKIGEPGIEKNVIREPAKFDPVKLELFIENIQAIKQAADWDSKSFFAASSLLTFRKIMQYSVIDDILQEKHLKVFPSDEPRHYGIEYSFGFSSPNPKDRRYSRGLHVYYEALYHALDDDRDFQKSQYDLPRIYMDLYENGSIVSFFRDFSDLHDLSTVEEIPLQPKGHMDMITAHPKEIWAEPTPFGFDQKSLNEIANLSPKFSQLIHNLLQNSNQSR